MKILNASKHALTLIFVATLVLGLVQLYKLDVTDENFSKAIIGGIFYLSLAVLLGVYRIHWIGRNKINWISFGLFILTLIGLLLMFVSPKNVMAFWKPTIAAFVLLCGQAYFLRLNRNNWSTWVAKGFLGITSILFLIPLLLETSSRDYYMIAWISLLGTGLFSIIQLFLPEKQH